MVDGYTEKLKEVMTGMSQEELIERIKICQEVVDKLGDNEVWQTVIKDANSWVSMLNSQWQEVYDETKLNQLRVLKLAYSHIASLPSKYKKDLEVATNMLDSLRNTDSSIQKDYDNETKMDAT